ncbi:MAG: hydrolase [Planctomycetota bacterium]
MSTRTPDALRTPTRRRGVTRRFVIQRDGAELNARIKIPQNPRGLVVFAHDSGSNHKSPRNTRIAWKLNEVGLATLLVDALTHAEQALDKVTRQLRFDFALHTRRLLAVLDWVDARGTLQELPLCLFGSSAGAVAALGAAAARPQRIASVVCRGGRLDRVDPEVLAQVQAPTLLLVGGLDHASREINRLGLEHLNARSALEVIPSASHLFGEPGKLCELAERAGVWFGGELPEREDGPDLLEGLGLGQDWASQPVVILGLDPDEELDWLPEPEAAAVADPAASGRGWALDWRAA